MEISLFAGERNSKPNQINKQTEITTAKKVHSEQQKKKSAKRQRRQCKQNLSFFKKGGTWTSASWKELPGSPSTMMKTNCCSKHAPQCPVGRQLYTDSQKTKDQFWLEQAITPGPEPGRGAVPFSSLWQMVVSAGTRVLPSTWWVSRQTERAACPAWYRWQTRLQRTCSQWGQRETSSESGTRGGRPPPQRHLPWALALWHRRRLPYQLLSLPSYCFPQIPARHGPHGITGGSFQISVSRWILMMQPYVLNNTWVNR